MKTIAIETGLENLKSQLEQRGYKVVDQNNSTESVFAYIYKSKYGAPVDATSSDTKNIVGDNTENAATSTFYQGIFSSLNTGFINNTIDSNSSILLIDASNKQIDEIVYMIENRLYSPLF